MNLEGNDITAEQEVNGGMPALIFEPHPGLSIISDSLFTSHDRLYGLDNNGVIHQLDAKPYNYDANYVSTYDTHGYAKNNDILQALRLGFVIGAHGSVPLSILDVGYGNGAFLKACEGIIPFRFGKDVTGIEVPGVELIDHYTKKANVITFHDCLEHIPDLSFVKDLPCTTVVISLPFCHYNTKGKAWFDDEYKHRKPDEHLHHFSGPALKSFMDSMGWQMISFGTHEDVVRKSPGKCINILTMAFKRYAE